MKLEQQDSKYNNLSSEHRELSSKYRGLSSKYKELSSEYYQLHAEIGNIRNERNMKLEKTGAKESLTELKEAVWCVPRVSSDLDRSRLK